MNAPWLSWRSAAWTAHASPAARGRISTYLQPLSRASFFAAASSQPLRSVKNTGFTMGLNKRLPALVGCGIDPLDRHALFSLDDKAPVCAIFMSLDATIALRRSDRKTLRRIRIFGMTQCPPMTPGTYLPG